MKKLVYYLYLKLGTLANGDLERPVESQAITWIIFFFLLNILFLSNLVYLITDNWITFPNNEPIVTIIFVILFFSLRAYLRSKKVKNEIENISTVKGIKRKLNLVFWPYIIISILGLFFSQGIIEEYKPHESRLRRDSLRVEDEKNARKLMDSIENMIRMKTDSSTPAHPSF